MNAKPLTTTDAAGVLGVSEQRIRALAGAGRIPGAEKVGRDWLFTAAGLSGFKRAAPHELSRKAAAGRLAKKLFRRKSKS